ncbi:prohead core protein [Pectobacterium phage POP12]|nr:prohead core protein [Pectobacterium phage POP12]
MSIKEQLLTEAQTLSVDVQLDKIFESVELSDEVKASFATVFEQSVKTNAVKLAESHINAIAESADQLVESKVTERTVEIETKLYEDVDKYFGHIAEEWLTENKEAVTRDIKADLFESLIVGMKELFVDHNVIIPESQVDVVAELEDELTENIAQNAALLEKVTNQGKEINEMKRDHSIGKIAVNLTESQMEKVQSLIEGLEFSDVFDTKLTAIVEMVSAVKEEKQEPVNETKDSFEQPKPENKDVNPMAKYTQAAIRLNQ